MDTPPESSRARCSGAAADGETRSARAVSEGVADVRDLRVQGPRPGRQPGERDAGRRQRGPRDPAASGDGLRAPRDRQAQGGPQDGDQPSSGAREAEGAGRLLPPVRHDGELGAPDPARAGDPRGADRQQGAGEGPHAVSDRRGAGLVALQRARQAREGFLRALRGDGPLGRDRRRARRRAAAPGGAKLPLPTRMLLGASEAVRAYWYVLILLTAAGVYAFRRYKKTEAGRITLDRLKLKVPVFGKLFHKTALSRFSSTLGMLLRSGVPILQALDIVTETVGNRTISIAVDDVKGSVREGESIAKPLEEHAVFPPMVVQMLAVGEETGAVDAMLEKVAKFYDDEVTATVDALTSLIEPLLIGFICGGGGGGAAFPPPSMPMFNIITRVQ